MQRSARGKSLSKNRILILLMMRHVSGSQNITTPISISIRIFTMMAVYLPPVYEVRQEVMFYRCPLTGGEVKSLVPGPFWGRGYPSLWSACCLVQVPYRVWGVGTLVSGPGPFQEGQYKLRVLPSPRQNRGTHPLDRRASVATPWEVSAYCGYAGGLCFCFKLC